MLQHLPGINKAGAPGFCDGKGTVYPSPRDSLAIGCRQYPFPGII